MQEYPDPASIPWNSSQVYKVLEDFLVAKNKAERDLKTYTNLVRK